MKRVKIIKIENGWECMHSYLTVKSLLWCKKTGKRCSKTGIPSWCPLEDEIENEE